MNRHEAIVWRRHLDAIGHGDAENTLAWASDAVEAGDPATARSVLATLPPPERNSATFHSVAARIALAMRDETSTDIHWREAARLDPGEDKYPMSLAKMRLGSRVPGVRAAALDALAEFSAKPGHGEDMANRHNVVLLGLLTHGEGGTIHGLAEMLQPSQAGSVHRVRNVPPPVEQGRGVGAVEIVRSRRRHRTRRTRRRTFHLRPASRTLWVCGSFRKIHESAPQSRHHGDGRHYARGE